jgi:CDP-glucose 4,6-dehydratase
VFLTGATGLLGGWLVRRLHTLRARVVCLVRDWVPESELVRGDWLSKVSVVRGDVIDRGTLERALAEFEVESVIHLAAQTIVGIANTNPWSTLETNVRGTYALLEACRRSPTVRQIVIASSDKAYGAQGALPYAEDMPLSGRHPYDVTKSCADLLAQMYATTFRLPVAITRCGNFYGGGDLNWNRIVPGTIRSLIHGEPPIIRSDGTMVRDYIYVEDAALAYTQLVEALAEDPSLAGEAFNYSNESPISVLELVKRITALMDRSDLSPVIVNNVSNEIYHQHLSAKKAKERLGWRPSFSLESGLQQTIGWYRQFFSESSDRVEAL